MAGRGRSQRDGRLGLLAVLDAMLELQQVAFRDLPIDAEPGVTAVQVVLSRRLVHYEGRESW